LRVFEALNFGTRIAGICTAAPVRGLRPVRPARILDVNLPKPATATSSPFLSDVVTSSITLSIMRSASALVHPQDSAIRSTRSILFICLIFMPFINTVDLINASLPLFSKKTSVSIEPFLSQWKSNFGKFLKNCFSTGLGRGSGNGSSLCRRAGQPSARRLTAENRGFSGRSVTTTDCGKRKYAKRAPKWSPQVRKNSYAASEPHFFPSKTARAKRAVHTASCRA